MNIERIKKQIAKTPKTKMDQKELEFVHRYLGTSKKILGAKTGDLVKIAKEIIREDSGNLKQIIKTITELLTSNIYEEHIIGGKVFCFLMPEIRNQISFGQLEKWLSKARGWVEIDVICQSTYTADEVLGRWDDWNKMIEKFSTSPNISLRRASLVLQTKPSRETNDKKFRQLSFNTIEKLKTEKDILITKAVSWLLRNLTFQDKEEVKGYLLKNESSLPRIAFRETMRKIETGKK